MAEPQDVNYDQRERGVYHPGPANILAFVGGTWQLLLFALGCATVTGFMIDRIRRYASR